MTCWDVDGNIVKVGDILECLDPSIGVKTVRVVTADKNRPAMWFRVLEIVENPPKWTDTIELNRNYTLHGIDVQKYFKVQGQ